MEKNSGFATKQIHTGKIEIPGIAPLATPISKPRLLNLKPRLRAHTALRVRKRAISTPVSAIPTRQKSAKSLLLLNMPKRAWQWQAAWVR